MSRWISTDGGATTVAFSVATLTEAVTSGISPSFFSTRAAHAAHVMPRIESSTSRSSAAVDIYPCFPPGLLSPSARSSAGAQPCAGPQDTASGLTARPTPELPARRPVSASLWHQVRGMRYPCHGVKQALMLSMARSAFWGRPEREPGYGPRPQFLIRRVEPRARLRGVLRWLLHRPPM